MADKKSKNYDIFDTALDYAAPVTGAVVGGLAGRALGRKASKTLRGESSRYSSSADELEAAGDHTQRDAWGSEKRRRREDRAEIDPGEYRPQDNDAQDYYEGANRFRQRARSAASRAMNAGNMGGVAGAGAGYATVGAATQKKR